MHSLQPLMRKWLGRFKLLPLLIVVASASFAVRFGEVLVEVKSFSGSAIAQERTAPATPAAPNAPATQPPQENLPAATPEIRESNIQEGSWVDASEAGVDASDVPASVFADLAKRREAVEKREGDLLRREALVKASEQELQLKYDELVKLRTEIEGLLTKQSEEENARIKSLVSIYENMKPKDAARIFNTLDMDVLLDVVGSMSERRTSPIIAEMDSERAKALTIMLAEQKKLPSLPAAGGLLGQEQPTGQ